MAENTVTGQTHGRVVAEPGIEFGVADAHHHLAGHPADPLQFLRVGGEGGWEGIGVWFAQVADVAAQRGIRKDQQVHPGAPGVLDDACDLDE